MMKWGLLAVCIAFSGLCQGAVQAAEITVVGGMGVISGIRDLAAGFEKATGHKVNAVFAPNVMGYVNAGMPADIVALNPPVIDDMIKSGKIVGTAGRLRARRDRRRGQGRRAEARPRLGRRLQARDARREVDRLFDGGQRPHGGEDHAGARPHRSAQGAHQIPRRLPGGRGGRARRGRDRAAADQRHPARRRGGARRGAAAGAAALQRIRRRRARDRRRRKAVAADMVKFMGAPENAALVRKSGMEPPAR